MSAQPSVPLILGGHSFIRQLGNDPHATEREQVEIVAACLDQGICWFDTTYQPERLALGRPYNVTTSDAGPAFAAAKALGAVN